MKQFKDILREKRKALGLKQYELAEKIDVCTDIVGRWERGEFYPTFFCLLDLADFFGCSVDELMGRS